VEITDRRYDPGARTQYDPELKKHVLRDDLIGKVFYIDGGAHYDPHTGKSSCTTLVTTLCTFASPSLHLLVTSRAHTHTHTHTHTQASARSGRCSPSGYWTLRLDWRWRRSRSTTQTGGLLASR
jgi:hypothetical protein